MNNITLLSLFNASASIICLLIAYIFTQSQKKNEASVKNLEQKIENTNYEMRSEYISKTYLQSKIGNLELKIESNQEIILEKMKKIEENTSKIEQYFLSDLKK